MPGLNGMQIFNRADHEKLKRLQRAIGEMLPEFDKAESCGMECEVFRQYAQQLQSQLTAVEQNFMTPAPTK